MTSPTIEQLDLDDQDAARQVQAVQRAAYRVEADLIGQLYRSHGHSEGHHRRIDLRRRASIVHFVQCFDEVRGELDGASQLDVSPDADVNVSTSGASSIDN